MAIRLRLGGVITAECHCQRADFFFSVFFSSVKAGGVEECYWGEEEFVFPVSSNLSRREWSGCLTFESMHCAFSC